jgi:hypothetical protein
VPKVIESTKPSRLSSASAGKRGVAASTLVASSPIGGPGDDPREEGDAAQRRASCAEALGSAPRPREDAASARCCFAGDAGCCFVRLRPTLTVSSPSFGNIIKHLRWMHACFLMPEVGGGFLLRAGVGGGNSQGGVAWSPELRLVSAVVACTAILRRMAGAGSVAARFG